MIEDIRLPEISENVEQASVVSILVSPGDQVESDQTILEIETDKASAEVPSTVSGTVKEILVSEGDEVAVGAVIARVDTEGAQTAPSPDEPAEEATAPDEAGGGAAEPDAGAADKQTPADTEPGRSGADAGQAPTPGAATAGTGAATDAPAEAAGAGPPSGAAPAGAAPPGQTVTEAGKPVMPPTAGGRVPAAPSTRRLARELGIDITEVTGTGPGGRVSADDVKRHTKERVGAAYASAGGGAPEAGLAGTIALPDFSRWGPVWREKLTTVRRITGENTQAAWRTIPHVTQFDEADVTGVEEFRTRFAKRIERSGAKLTVTAILMKVVARALRRFPRFNSSLDASAGEIIYKDYVHISVAADTDRGLLVPVIRDADRKSILTLSKELGELAERARNKHIKPEEMEGGTFTISTLGGIGGIGFTPVVFPPQVAILGVARSETKPVWQDGEFVPRLRLPLSLSYDHRVVDGADGARFLRWICESLEQPLFMELEGEGDE